MGVVKLIEYEFYLNPEIGCKLGIETLWDNNSTKIPFPNHLHFFRFIKHKNQPSKLELPDHEVLNSTQADIAALASDPDIVKQLRRLCVQWTNELVQTLTYLANRVTLFS